MKTDAAAVIDRMKLALGVQKDRELVDALGVVPSVLSRAKKTGNVPLNWFYTLETKYGVRKTYLETGEGEMHMPGSAKTAIDPEKKWATAIFSTDGEETVYSQHPAAGIVTNASGLKLPVNHYAEYVLALEVRPKLDASGALQLTGSGLPLPRERLKRWHAEEGSVRTLRTTDGLAVFDLSQTDEYEGRSYVVAMGDMLLARRYAVGASGPEFVAVHGTSPAIPAGNGGNTRILGRVVMLCLET